jgi:ribosome assembly protein 1
MKKIQEGESSEVEHLGSQEFDSQIEFGFQIATFQGPLCAEPVEGIAYFLQSVQVDSDGLEQERGALIVCWTWGR